MHIIFMQFSGFFLVGPVTLKKPMKALVQFFLLNHRTDLVFKTKPKTLSDSIKAWLHRIFTWAFKITYWKTGPRLIDHYRSRK
jgi:hypothetical protein